MKIKAMLVDDEYLERVLIQKSYNWDEKNIEIVAEAENGKIALELYKKLRPQLMLVDINMPIMDGLELSRQVKNIDSLTEIIIITSYNDFNYAKESIKIGVTSYLLKPLNKKELMLTIDETMDRLSENYANKKILRDSFLQRLVAGRISDVEFEKKIFEYHLQFLKGNFNLINISIKDNCYCHSISEFIDKLEDILKVYKPLVFEHYSGNIIILVPDGFFDDSFLQPDYADLGVSKLYSGKSGVEESYRETIRLLAGKLVIKNNITLKNWSDQNEFYLESLRKSFQNNEFHDCLSILNDYFDVIRKEIDIKIIKIMQLNLVFSIITILWENGYDLIDITNSNEIYSVIANEKELTKTHSKILDFAKEAHRFYVNKCLVKNNENLERISKYIDENISNSELSLKAIAGKFYLNDSYLSRIFKQYFNKNITRYIAEKRVQKAAEILRSRSLKSYEVAYEVGIYDAQYFSKFFKKYMGMSVNEYKSRFKRDHT